MVNRVTGVFEMTVAEQGFELMMLISPKISPLRFNDKIDSPFENTSTSPRINKYTLSLSDPSMSISVLAGKETISERGSN